MARQPERSQFDKGFYRYALGQGIGFGQGDEAEAYLRSKISGRPYEESLDRVRREMANYQKQYPRTSSIAEFGGALTPSVLLALTGVGAGPAAVNTLKNVGTLQRVLRGPGGFGGKVMRTGKRAALGGSGGYIGGDIAGAGYSEAPYRSPQFEADRKQARETGALFGGITTPIFEPALRSIGRFLKRKFGSGKTVDEVVGDELSIATGGPSGARAARDEVVEAQELDIPMVPMGVNPDLLTLAEVVKGKGGEPGRRIQESAESITGGSQKRIEGKVGEASPYSGQTYIQTVDAIADSRTAQSGPIYEKAFYELDVQGNPVMVNGRKKEIMLTDGQEGYEEITGYLQRPAFQNGLRNAIKIAKEKGLDNEVVDLTTLLTRLSQGETPPISLALLNKIKRGVDDVVLRSYKDGKPTDLTRVIREEKNKFLDSLDNLFPEYGNARRIYSDKSAMLNAGEEMQKRWNKMKPEEVQKFLDGLKSEAERDTAKMAAVDILQNKILDPVAGRDFAQMLGGNEKGGANIRSKIRMLFGNDFIKADNFEKAMMLETELYRRINGLSKATNEVKEATVQYDKRTASNSNAGGIIFGDDGLVRKMARLFMGSTESDEFQDQVSLKISELLSDGSPESIATVVKLVDKASEKIGRKVAQDMIQPFGVGAATANVTEAPNYRYLEYEE
jgi:hypothetical protein